MLIITNPAINPNIGNMPGVIGGDSAFQAILSSFINFALIISGVLFLFLLLWGGVEYMLAGGDKEATQKASKRISNAFIGLVLVLVSFAIIKLVGAIFGINLIEFNIPTIS